MKLFYVNGKIKKKVDLIPVNLKIEVTIKKKKFKKMKHILKKKNLRKKNEKTNKHSHANFSRVKLLSLTFPSPQLATSELT